jgi:hypothetical protein
VTKGAPVDASALVFLLFLIPCVLMVVLMLRGRGHGGHDESRSR